jgi:hypothetical protein
VLVDLDDDFAVNAVDNEVWPFTRTQPLVEHAIIAFNAKLGLEHALDALLLDEVLAFEVGMSAAFGAHFGAGRGRDATTGALALDETNIAGGFVAGAAAGPRSLRRSPNPRPAAGLAPRRRLNNVTGQNVPLAARWLLAGDAVSGAGRAPTRVLAQFFSDVDVVGLFVIDAETRVGRAYGAVIGNLGAAGGVLAAAMSDIDVILRFMFSAEASDLRARRTVRGPRRTPPGSGVLAGFADNIDVANISVAGTVPSNLRSNRPIRGQF